MASKNQATDSTAIIEHFREMPFEEQLTCLKDLQAIVEDGAQEKRRELLARLSELDELTGKGSASAPSHAGEREPKTRGTVAAKFRSKKEPSVTWSGRGGTPRWLVAEMAESGEPKESFLIKEAAE